MEIWVTKIPNAHALSTCMLAAGAFQKIWIVIICSEWPNLVLPVTQKRTGNTSIVYDFKA